ncbi:Uncharacterised protein [Cedecea neteri]|uniref:Uncharacterized protein n=1 Tax=Cedecea neteri TaxID=158822 RepID=A0A2X3L5B8_9ENTR|nr:Uncharacterised protein [Cedecea neteri]
MDAVAVSYAAELSRWGIESSILVPGAFTKGTNHFLHSGKPRTASVSLCIPKLAQRSAWKTKR